MAANRWRQSVSSFSQAARLRHSRAWPVPTRAAAEYGCRRSGPWPRTGGGRELRHSRRQRGCFVRGHGPLLPNVLFDYFAIYARRFGAHTFGGK